MPDSTVRGISTYQTYLCEVTTEGNKTTYDKIIDIKSFPDLGGEPELIDITTMSDSMQVQIKGIQQLDAMSFTANYRAADYTKVNALSGVKTYAVLFTEDEGTTFTGYKWNGEVSVYINGGDVNAGVEMTITAVASTAIEQVTGIPKASVSHTTAGE